MLKLIKGAAVAAALATTAHAQNLTSAAWEEDIQTAVAGIRDNHPQPFQAVSENDFDKAVDALIDDLGELSDQDTALRLAALVSLIEDGHTRLSIPRTHSDFAYNTSHSRPDAPAHASLQFSILPFRFYQFDDGLFIIEASAAHAEFIGARVLSIGDTSAENAMAAVRPILDAENDMGAKILGADRLLLPGVLKHFDIIDSTKVVPLTLERNGAVESHRFTPVPADQTMEIKSASFPAVPLMLQKPEAVKWHARVPGERAWYIHVDEIEMFPEVLLSDFMADALRQAKRSRARKIILDLRQNHGGTASFNASIINALSQSEYNEYGRLYILIGRETFSAASMLVSAFEQFTNAIFVGEPPSARPSSFGDPRRIQLPNSGLTLRVSTLAWQSWLAGDFRPYIDAHIDAAPNANAYFAGRDPAIEAALDYTPPSSPAAQMRELFEKDKLQSGLVRFFGWLNAPVDGSHDAVDELVAFGHDYLDDGELQKGRFMMAMARDYYPGNADARAGLGRAMELNDDPESALRRYEEALDLDPTNQVARDGVARLSGDDGA